MRRVWLGLGGALFVSLLCLVPGRAQEASDTLAGVVGAGAPLAASVASTTPPGPGATSSLPASGVAPGAPTDIAPAVGLPEVPNPLELLGGLDPREWAREIVEAAVGVVAEALLSALRGFIDWSLGLTDSSVNFVTRTPAEGSVESATVLTLWDFTRAVANAGLAFIVMWGGFNVIVKEHIRSPYHEAMELLPRVILAAVALNLTLEFTGLLIDANNAFAAAVDQTGLPGYEDAVSEQDGLAGIFVGLAYLVVALLLVFQMLMRLALIDVLIVLAPLMVLLWVLPQTQSWARWWAHLLPVTVFQQAVQMLVLRLGSALMVELAPDSGADFVLTVMLGIAVCWLTLKVPALLRSQVQHAGMQSGTSLLVVGRAAGGVAGRAGAAASAGAAAGMGRR